MIAARIVPLGLTVLTLGCLARRGEGEEPAKAEAPPSATDKPAEPVADRPSDSSQAPAEAPPVVTVEGSPEPCAALSACCEGIVGEELCLRRAKESNPIGCVLSMYWAYCPDVTRPDVSGGGSCFRAKGGCHDSLLAACEAQGCAEPDDAHGCYLTGDDRREVHCGNW